MKLAFITILCLFFVRVKGAPILMSENVAATWAEMQERITLLNTYEGNLQLRTRPVSAVVHGTVVFIGMIGMFAAVVGACLGNNMLETTEVNSSDFQTFWANDSDSDDCAADGVERESIYHALRVGDEYL